MCGTAWRVTCFGRVRRFSPVVWGCDGEVVDRFVGGLMVAAASWYGVDERHRGAGPMTTAQVRLLRRPYETRMADGARR